MSQKVPGVIASTLSTPNIFIQKEPFIQGSDVLVDSALTDAGSTPTSRIRPGQVLVLDTATGRYFPANGATGDRNAGASVSALETADTDWQSSVITITFDGALGIAVTLGAADDTDAEVVVALNANAIFAANAIADVSGGVVRIRTLEAGRHKHLTVVSDLATAYGATAIEDSGSDADYRVATDYVSLVDDNNTAVSAPCATALVGFFDESNLRNLTSEARATLSRSGSFFG